MNTVTYKCPNCDGELLFDPNVQKFVCPYCKSDFVETDLASPPVDEKAAAEGESVLYSCPSCGAEIVTDETTAATQCFYCHNPVVLKGRLDGAYRPQKLIPFAFDREEAVRRFLAWTKKKWFVPKYFFQKEQIETLTGVYFPHWLIDCDLTASMDAHAERVRVWRTGNTEYIETSHYRLERKANIHFEDVVKAALKKSDRALVESVQPYDSKNLIPFSMPYLSGFFAEKRDIERTELQSEVEQEVKGYCRSLLTDTMSSYSNIRPSSEQITPLQENWDYTLLPVWTLTYQGKDGKLYYYAMNGQNGQTFGKLPLNKAKLFAVAAAVFAAVFGLTLLGGLLL